MKNFIPLAYADKINIPVFIMDAEKEHLFDIRKSGEALYNAIKDRVPAIEWFKQYL